jgi:hypothetical protein
MIKRLQEYISFSLAWVEGHYSGDKKELQHILNEDAHQLATSALATTQDQYSKVSPPSSVVAIWCRFILTSKWQTILSERMHSNSLCQTICKNNHWTEDQFNSVDWAVLQSCLQRFSRMHLLSYCKLMHGILNTYEQNHKFYKLCVNCPHCRTEKESFLHVLSCSDPEVMRHRGEQQKTLWKALKQLQTPSRILAYLKEGITAPSLSEVPSLVLSQPSPDSSDPSNFSQIEDLGSLAFHQQSESLGWDYLRQGGLSKLWGEAYFQESMSHQHWVNKRLWVAKIIECFLTYSLSLWKFRCSLLHGRLREETQQKLSLQLKEEVTAAYIAFYNNPFIVYHIVLAKVAVHVEQGLLSCGASTPPPHPPTLLWRPLLRGHHVTFGRFPGSTLPILNFNPKGVDNQ